MNKEKVLEELKALGTDQAIKIYKNHGCDIDLFGVSMANIKKLAKKYKNNHQLGYELLYSNNADALYLSQFLVDSNKLTIEDIEQLINKTDYYMMLDNVASNLLAKNKELATTYFKQWLNDPFHRKRQVAYNVYSLLLGSTPNELLDINHVKETLDHVKEVIHTEENRVRYSMNNFVISAGAAFPELTDYAKEVAQSIGKVEVSMGKTACKVPDAKSYIEKIETMGNVGKKRPLK